MNFDTCTNMLTKYTEHSRFFLEFEQFKHLIYILACQETIDSNSKRLQKSKYCSTHGYHFASEVKEF